MDTYLVAKSDAPSEEDPANDEHGDVLGGCIEDCSCEEAEGTNDDAGFSSLPSG